MSEYYDFLKYYDFLNEYVCEDATALDLAFSLCGCNENTASDILFYFTGYTDFEEYAKDNELPWED